MGHSRAKQNRVFDTMCRHAGFEGEGGRVGPRQGGGWWWLRSTWSIGHRELLCAFHILFGIFSLSVLLLLLFASFAVLSNCPYPDPRVFAFFFPFSSIAQWGKG